LDAALRGGVYEGAETIGTWGKRVARALQRSSCPYSLHLLAEIAYTSIRSIMMNCPCESIAEEILANPDAFVRTALMIARAHASANDATQPMVLH